MIAVGVTACSSSTPHARAVNRNAVPEACRYLPVADVSAIVAAEVGLLDADRKQTDVCDYGTDYLPSAVPPASCVATTLPPGEPASTLPRPECLAVPPRAGPARELTLQLFRVPKPVPKNPGLGVEGARWRKVDLRASARPAQAWWVSLPATIGAKGRSRMLTFTTGRYFGVITIPTSGPNQLRWAREAASIVVGNLLSTR